MAGLARLCWNSCNERLWNTFLLSAYSVHASPGETSWARRSLLQLLLRLPAVDGWGIAFSRTQGLRHVQALGGWWFVNSNIDLWGGLEFHFKYNVNVYRTRVQHTFEHGSTGGAQTGYYTYVWKANLRRNHRGVLKNELREQLAEHRKKNYLQLPLRCTLERATYIHCWTFVRIEEMAIAL